MSNVLVIDNETEAGTAYQQKLGRKLVAVRILKQIVVCVCVCGMFVCVRSCWAHGRFRVLGVFDSVGLKFKVQGALGFGAEQTFVRFHLQDPRHVCGACEGRGGGRDCGEP